MHACVIISVSHLNFSLRDRCAGEMNHVPCANDVSSCLLSMSKQDRFMTLIIKECSGLINALL